MRLSEMNLFEAVSLYCPNCDEDLGKDTENCNPAYCGNCGERFRNPRGYRCGSDEPVAPKAAPATQSAPAATKPKTVLLTVSGDIVARDVRYQGKRVPGFVAKRADGTKKAFLDQKKAEAWINSAGKRVKK